MSAGRRLLPVRFCLSSYAPLFGILALRLESWRVAGTCAALAVIGVVTTVSLFRGTGRLQPESYKVTSVIDRGPEVAGYVATYLLPFLTVAQPSGRDLLATFLAVSGIIYVRTSMVAINPVLYLMGYRVVSVTNTTGLDAFVICHSRPAPDSVLHAAEIVPGVLFMARK